MSRVSQFLGCLAALVFGLPAPAVADDKTDLANKALAQLPRVLWAHCPRLRHHL